MDNTSINSNMLQVGTILHGTYRIDGYLSSGGFGNTYVATNIEFGEKYAIKEFFWKGISQRDDNSTSVSVSNIENETAFASQLEKFKKEARRLRRLNSEHIVRVYDLFEENGTAYYVMDYVDGENLSTRMKRLGRALTEEEAKTLFPQILDALDVAHKAGILHLDLKPANIMVDKQGNVKLIDFGASKQQSASGGATATSAIAFSKGYAPREQQEQNPSKFGPWTDFYALGATLYNLLTNKRPPLPSDIDDDTTSDKHLALPMSATISNKTKTLVVWLMATNRKDRPQNVNDIRIFLAKQDSELPKSTLISSNNENDVTLLKEESKVTNGKINDSDATIIKETESHHVIPVYRTISSNGLTWILVSVEFTAEVSIFRWKVYCDEEYAYIYNDGSEYCIDKAINKEYYIQRSEGIGSKKNPTFLVEANKAVEFTEYFQALSPTVKFIDYHMGGDNVIKNINLTGSDQYEIAQVKYSIDHLPTQQGKTINDLEQIAESSNDSDLQLTLAYMYFTDDFVPQNMGKAVKWSRKSAEQGNADAQAFLATRYYNGEGMSKDYSQAVKWYRKAAEQGNSDAEFMLWQCYFDGYGVPKNSGNAFYWCSRAANHGDEDAQFSLGLCYENGYGTPINFEKARFWYQKAADAGNEEAKKQLEQLEKSLHNNNSANNERGYSNHEYSSKPTVKAVCDKESHFSISIWKILKYVGIAIFCILAALAKGLKKGAHEMEKVAPRAGYVIEKGMENGQSENYDDTTDAVPALQNVW